MPNVPPYNHAPRGPLAGLCREAHWFHSIDFGDGLVSPGRFGLDVPPNFTLYGIFQLLTELELDGAFAVDVGTMDGLISFGMKLRGAARVLATDLSPRPTFEAGRDHLKLDVEYHVPVDVFELGTLLDSDRADLLVLAGVLYHVLDPVAVLRACRHAVKVGGYLLLETSYQLGEARPHLVFNPTDPSMQQMQLDNVFWRPSKSALEGMLALTGFDVVATVASDRRLAVLAQARRPGEVDTKAPLLRAILDEYDRNIYYNEDLNLETLRERRDAPARVSYHGPPGDRRIYPSLRKPSFPLEPEWTPRTERVRWQRAVRSAAFHAVASIDSFRSRLASRKRRLTG